MHRRSHPIWLITSDASCLCGEDELAQCVMRCSGTSRQHGATALSGSVICWKVKGAKSYHGRRQRQRPSEKGKLTLEQAVKQTLQRAVTRPDRNLTEVGARLM